MKRSLSEEHTRLPSGPIAAWGVVLVSLLLVAGRAAAETVDAGAKPAAEPDRHPDLKRLSRTDEIWLDVEGKRLVVGGLIALAEGPIEVFACQEKSKEHEAIVATRCPARLIHAGLLALGLEPGRTASFDPEYRAATGPKVRVGVRWRDADGRSHERPAQELIRDTKTGRHLEADWVFAGSGFWTDSADGTEHYQADGGDMICVSNFPTSMLDLPIQSGESNATLLFEAFPGRVPPRGTAVELILSPAE